ncbi:unnamed protein product [Cladocopium goreaui]|uniref:UMP-CMP kinase n=1 Tax=Cladocopium goreaui TaxID=2562237 RepID=A0A9P1CAC8_9DINO|nr:unnamed protein product [Cladocopium goreaui]
MATCSLTGARRILLHRWVRQLGDSVQGPQLMDLPGNWQKAKEFFTKPALSYGQYKQQCVSLRIFAFSGICGGCVLSLAMFPPKSSYWITWSPLYWLSYAKQCFTGAAPPLFLEKQHGAQVAALLRPETQAPAPSDTDVSTVAVAPAPAATTTATSAASASPCSVASSASATVLAAPAKPRVVFVLGGPGAGKGTQCAKICDAYPQWQHISAGDCLRAERQDPNSKDGELINSYIKDGKIVPVQITVRLLHKAMQKGQKEGKTDFLIDGFPRNWDNVNGWEEVIGDSAEVMGVLFFEASLAEMEKRLLGRSVTSGRVDDNLESIRKRFATYEKETKPILEKYQKEHKVFKIDAMQSVDFVWAHTQTKLREVVPCQQV